MWAAVPTETEHLYGHRTVHKCEAPGFSQPFVERTLSLAPSRIRKTKERPAHCVCGYYTLTVETGHKSQRRQNVPCYAKPSSVWKTRRICLRLSFVRNAVKQKGILTCPLDHKSK